MADELLPELIVISCLRPLHKEIARIQTTKEIPSNNQILTILKQHLLVLVLFFDTRKVNLQASLRGRFDLICPVE